MSPTLQTFMTEVENHEKANQAILQLQGYAPETQFEKNQLNLVRKTLIEMRDEIADRINKIATKLMQENKNDR